MKARLAALGVPASVPVFYAFDTDDRGHDGWQTAVSAYLQAAQVASGRTAMPYGSVRVVDYFGAGWQACAWSGSDVSAHAWIYQRAKPTLTALAGTDEDLIFNPAALWLPGSAAPVTTTKPTAPIVAKPNPALVTALQRAVRMPADGKWGPETDTALQWVVQVAQGHPLPRSIPSLQARVGTKADGIWGPASKAAEVATVKVIQTALHVAADGAWGPITNAAYAAARSANLNKF